MYRKKETFSQNLVLLDYKNMPGSQVRTVVDPTTLIAIKSYVINTIKRMPIKITFEHSMFLVYFFTYSV